MTRFKPHGGGTGIKTSQSLLLRVFRNDRLERVLGQAANDDEKMWTLKRTIQFAKPHEPITNGREDRELTHCFCRSWCEICVGAISPDGHHKRRIAEDEKIPVIEFDYTFGNRSSRRHREKSRNHGSRTFGEHFFA